MYNARKGVENMKQIVLNVQKEYTCDVVVCGGGVSGFAAAVAAARTGADTILIESGGFLGGTATKGLVGPFMTCYDAKGQRQIIQGLFSELVDRLILEKGARSHRECRGGDAFSAYRTVGHFGVTPFDAETLKRVTEKMCLEAGVRLLYHTTVIGCEKTGNALTHVYAAAPDQILSVPICLLTRPAQQPLRKRQARRLCAETVTGFCKQPLPFSSSQG